jgi:hypothetical protein
LSYAYGAQRKRKNRHNGQSRFHGSPNATQKVELDFEEVKISRDWGLCSAIDRADSPLISTIPADDFVFRNGFCPWDDAPCVVEIRTQTVPINATVSAQPSS